LLSNTGNNDSPLKQLPSVHHNSCDGHAHDTEERKDNGKKKCLINKT